MVAELVWSSEAREDLLDIYALIGLDNSAAAERRYATIQAPRRSDQLGLTLSLRDGEIICTI